MKARILNNEFKGIYTNDFILNNLDNLINGQLVSEWQLTEVLPSGNLLKPIWNGTEFIEGATSQEIAEQTQFQIQEYKIQQYQELLPTDWYYTRFLETGQEVPLEIIQLRQEIRERYNNLINEINNE